MGEMASTTREINHIAMGITEDKQKRALLLHYGGPEVDEIFDVTHFKTSVRTRITRRPSKN